MAAVGGSLLGAALGDSSLLASIPVIATGIYKSSLGLTMAGTGMALALGYKEGNEGEGFISRALNRLASYFGNLIDKITGIFRREGKPLAGAVKTMLGYIPKDKIQHV